MCQCLEHAVTGLHTIGLNMPKPVQKAPARALLTKAGQ